MVMTTLYVLHWFAAMLIALQSIDRIFQCPLRKKGLCIKARLSMALKGVAWMFMAIAALGAMAGPMFRGVPLGDFPANLINPLPSLAEIFLFIGFATLIVRSWVNEALACKRAKSGERCPAMAPTNAKKNPVKSHIHTGAEA